MEFQILGPLEVHCDGRAIAVGGEKRRALLSVLLLHPNQPVSAERLAQALWGEDVPVGAVKTVRVYASRIRAALERELGNLRAALDAWITRGDGERALRLAAAIEPYWSTSCHYRDGAEMVDAALAAAPTAGTRARGRARLARSILLRHVSMDESAEDADTALELSAAAGDLEGRCMALDEGQYEAAAELADEGLRAAEEAGESFALSLAIGNVGLAALFLERMDVAEARFREQLEIVQRERIEGLWDEPVAGLACVAAAGGDRERAATLIGGHDALPFLPLAGGDLRVRDRLLARYLAPARAAHGERAWRRAAAAGAAMTLEELFEFALDRRRAAAASAPGPRNP